MVLLTNPLPTWEYVWGFVLLIAFAASICAIAWELRKPLKILFYGCIVIMLLA